MSNQQLLDYIKQQLQQGVNVEEIKSSLLNSGWQQQDIDEAFNLVAKEANQPQQPQPPVPQQKITSLPGARSLLASAWAIYKSRLRTFLGIMIIAILLYIPLTVITLSGGFLGFSLYPSSVLTPTSLVLLILLSIFYIFVQALEKIALIYAIYKRGEKIGVIDSYRKGWRKIISYAWISTLSSIIIVGGSLLFLIPGVIFIVWFSLAPFILVSEDIKGMNALLKSREYIRDKLMSVFGRLLFIYIILIVIYLIEFAIFSILDLPLVKTIIGYLTYWVITPLSTIYSFLIYENLKSIKGEFSFTPTRRRKALYLLIGLLGLILIPIALLAPLLLILFGPYKKRPIQDRYQRIVYPTEKIARPTDFPIPTLPPPLERIEYPAGGVDYPIE